MGQIQEVYIFDITFSFIREPIFNYANITEKQQQHKKQQQ